MFELELSLGDCEGVYDLLPSGEGLGRVPELVLLQVLAAIVELQRHVQLFERQVVRPSVLGGFLAVKVVPKTKELWWVDALEDDAFTNLNKA